MRTSEQETRGSGTAQAYPQIQPYSQDWVTQAFRTTRQQPSGEQSEAINAVNQQCERLATSIITYCPASSLFRARALENLHGAMLLAQQAILNGGQV